MAGSANIVSPGPFPGLTLRAFAFVKADGTLLRGFNIASVTKGSTGSYTLNLTAAMPDQIVMHDFKFPFFSASAGLYNFAASSTTAIGYSTTLASTFTDMTHYVAVYGA